MAVYLVTYDLRQPGKDYAPVHAFLKQFAYCKDLESVWLLDTNWSAQQIRDGLNQRIDKNDKNFVVRLTREWGSYNYGCSDWLNSANRTW
jgi:hypothetical protein